MRGLTVALLGAVGVAMLAAGPVMVVRGKEGRDEIRDELRRQTITFPDKGLPAGLTPYAGRPVTTGPQARAYAQVIGDNVRQATGGRTYSEISAEFMAAGGEDENLAALRQTAFMGETLRASLMGSYQAWQLTSLVIGLGALLTGAGAAFVAAGAALASGDDR
ncbi:hypothetical protein GCM10010517_35480 [Streptosporangium fragile]|uniref:Aromatic ring-opening dioxygenase LigA n=2 Tax=Streptosporangium fragile TaxID=46186 RepID=A0ABN3VYM5_9ACTN